MRRKIKMNTKIKMKMKIRGFEKLDFEVVNVRVGLVIATPPLQVTNLTPPSKLLGLITILLITSLRP